MPVGGLIFCILPIKKSGRTVQIIPLIALIEPQDTLTDIDDLLCKRAVNRINGSQFLVEFARNLVIIFGQEPDGIFISRLTILGFLDHETKFPGGFFAVPFHNLHVDRPYGLVCEFEHRPHTGRWTAAMLAYRVLPDTTLPADELFA